VLAQHWKAHEDYGPQVETNLNDLMGEAAEKVYPCWSHVLSPHERR
jgi:hypothetical protein